MTLDADFAALQDASTLVDEIARTLATEKARMHERITLLVSEGWSGEAADQYRQAWADWVDGADKVLAALHAESTLIATHRVQLHASDQSTVQGMSSLLSRLGGGPA
jgi:WXG100 family type VII secretion target